MPELQGRSAVSDETRRRIYAVVEVDLKPSKALVYAKTGVSVLVGGLASLFFCGQSELGFSDLARDANAWIMQQGGGIGCVAFCGALFAVIPAFVLRLMSSPLQYRVLLRREWMALVVWTGLFGAYMGNVDHAGNPLWGVLIWTASGCLTFKLVALIVDRAASAQSITKLFQKA